MELDLFCGSAKDSLKKNQVTLDILKLSSLTLVRSNTLSRLHWKRGILLATGVMLVPLNLLSKDMDSVTKACPLKTTKWKGGGERSLANRIPEQQHLRTEGTMSINLILGLGGWVVFCPHLSSRKSAKPRKTVSEPIGASPAVFVTSKPARA